MEFVNRTLHSLQALDTAPADVRMAFRKTRYAIRDAWQGPQLMLGGLFVSHVYLPQALPDDPGLSLTRCLSR